MFSLKYMNYISQLQKIIEEKHILKEYIPFLIDLFNKVLLKDHLEITIEIGINKINGCRIGDQVKLENIIFTLDNFIEPDETFNEFLGFLILGFERFKRFETFTFNIIAISVLDFLVRIISDKTYSNIKEICEEFEKYGFTKITSTDLNIEIISSEVEPELMEVINEFKEIYPKITITNCDKQQFEQRNFKNYYLIIDSNVKFTSSIDDKNEMFKFYKSIVQNKFNVVKPQLIKQLNKIVHNHRATKCNNIFDFKQALQPIFNKKWSIFVKQLNDMLINIELMNIQDIKIENETVLFNETSFIISPYTREIPTKIVSMLNYDKPNNYIQN